MQYSFFLGFRSLVPPFSPLFNIFVLFPHCMVALSLFIIYFGSSGSPLTATNGQISYRYLSQFPTSPPPFFLYLSLFAPSCWPVIIQMCISPDLTFHVIVALVPCLALRSRLLKLFAYLLPLYLSTPSSFLPLCPFPLAWHIYLFLCTSSLVFFYYRFFISCASISEMIGCRQSTNLLRLPFQTYIEILLD